MANGRARRALSRATLAGAAWLAGAQSVEDTHSAGEVPTLSLEGVRDATGEGLVTLEVRAERSRVFVGETVPLTWRVSFDARFFVERLIQLFRRSLDVPVQIQTRALAALGEPTSAEPGPGEGVVSLAFDDQVIGARRLLQEPGSDRILFELERRYRPAAAGELELSPTLLRYAFATRYREDLLHERVPLDRHDAYVRSNALALSVVPLPEEGRPPEFSGLVGSLTLRATAEPDEVQAGEPLRLSLSLTSDGDLGALRAPRIDERSGLRVQGTFRQAEAAGLTLVYDLVPESAELRELPSVPFVVFDPTPPGTYRTVQSPPVPVTVRPRREPAPATRPSDARPAADGARPLLLAGTAAILLGLPVVLALRRARRRSRVAASEARARAQRAADAFHARAAAASAEELSHALLAFLAALLGASEASVIGPDLRRRLVAAGAAREPATRAAELLDELMGARYGGPAARVDEAELRALVAELAASSGPRTKR